MDKTLVVIPYCSEGAQGRELEYAVAGWRKHFKEDYLIVLAGEDHPITKTGPDITCIPSERVPDVPGQYRQHLDYVSCFRKVRKAFPYTKGFVFVADDCYAVNDFDLNDVKVLKQAGPTMEADPYSENGWVRDQAKTKAILERFRLPTRNFTTHIPIWFDWDKIQILWNFFSMDRESYVIENLYFNFFYPTRIPLQLSMAFDNFKCGVYRPNPNFNRIREAFSGQIWITNSPEGWSDELDRMLADYYKKD